MTILNDFSLAMFEFTWDPNNPNYSTNGQFDPAKFKSGTGSCYLTVTQVKQNIDRRHFSSTEAPETVADLTYIVGVGVIPP